jgi:hypothetical protein
LGATADTLNQLADQASVTTAWVFVLALVFFFTQVFVQ